MLRINIRWSQPPGNVHQFLLLESQWFSALALEARATDHCCEQQSATDKHRLRRTKCQSIAFPSLALQLASDSASVFKKNCVSKVQRLASYQPRRTNLFRADIDFCGEVPAFHRNTGTLVWPYRGSPGNILLAWHPVRYTATWKPTGWWRWILFKKTQLGWWCRNEKLTKHLKDMPAVSLLLIILS